jgi:hypothetical protein
VQAPPQYYRERRKYCGTLSQHSPRTLSSYLSPGMERPPSRISIWSRMTWATQGKRDELDEDRLNMILEHSISDEELRQAFEGDAGKLVLIVDACNSGLALEAEEKRRGPMNSKGLAQRAYEKGRWVLTASQSYLEASTCIEHTCG